MTNRKDLMPHKLRMTLTRATEWVLCLLIAMAIPIPSPHGIVIPLPLKGVLLLGMHAALLEVERVVLRPDSL